jgi:hypothetical protein
LSAQFGPARDPNDPRFQAYSAEPVQLDSQIGRRANEKPDPATAQSRNRDSFGLPLTGLSDLGTRLALPIVFRAEIGGAGSRPLAYHLVSDLGFPANLSRRLSLPHLQGG